jgi:hypothetical protein
MLDFTSVKWDEPSVLVNCAIQVFIVLLYIFKIIIRICGDGADVGPISLCCMGMRQ